MLGVVSGKKLLSCYEILDNSFYTEWRLEI